MNSRLLRLPSLGRSQPVDPSPLKPHIGYFKALYMSFYSVWLFVDVKHRWRGFGFRYLLLLTVCCMLPSIAMRSATLYNYYRDVLYPGLSQLPPVVIKDGKFSHVQQQPQIIRDPRDHSPLFVVDTINQEAGLGRHSLAKVLITTEGIWLHLSPDIAVSHTPWREFDDGDFSQSIISMFTRIASVLFTALCPILIGLFYGGALSAFSLMGLLFQFFSSTILRYAMSTKEAIRLLIVASTPSFMLLGLSSLMNWHSPVVGGLIVVGLCFFFIFAVRANKYAAKELIVVR